MTNGVNWSEIRGLQPGDIITVTVSSVEEDNCISYTYTGHHGKRKKSGYVKFPNFDYKEGEDASLKITELGRIDGDKRTVYAELDDKGTDEFSVEICRPSPGYLYDEVWSTVAYGDLQGSLPKSMKITEESRGYPVFHHGELEVRVPGADLGDEVTISSVQVKEEWDGELIEASTEEEQDNISKLPSLGETFTSRVDRISESGNGIIELEDCHINIGPIKHRNKKIEAKIIMRQSDQAAFAYCKTSSIRTRDYERILEDIILPTSLEFCDECGSVMHLEESIWECSRCGNIIEQGSKHSSSPDGEPQLTEAQERYSQRKVRSRDPSFSESVRDAYNEACAVCGKSRKNPEGNPEVEAAHIYPRGEGGANDVRNGLALCKLHHWAFDSGWISLSDNYEILVKDAPDYEGYHEFSQFRGDKIHLPNEDSKKPHQKFLEEHRRIHGFD